jgi:hypothetical protein
MAAFTFNFPEDGKSYSLVVRHAGRSWTEKWVWEPTGYICTTPDWDVDLPQDLRDKLDDMPFDPSGVAFGLLEAGTAPAGDEIDHLFDDLDEDPDASAGRS